MYLKLKEHTLDYNLKYYEIQQMHQGIKIISYFKHRYEF